MNRDPEAYDPISPEIRQRLIENMKHAPFPAYLGLVYEDIRLDYSRMRMPYRPELNQPAGIVHGGAIASLIDTAVVGAIFSAMGTNPTPSVTVDMHIHYLSAAIREDLIAHARVRRRGRKMIYLEVEVVSESGKEVAHGELAYFVMDKRP